VKAEDQTSVREAGISLYAPDDTLAVDFSKLQAALWESFRTSSPNNAELPLVRIENRCLAELQTQ
jgi:hypothetical protein